MKERKRLRCIHLPDGKNQVEIKASKLCDLAEFYGVDPKTMRTHIRRMKRNVGERIGHYFTPRQVGMIIEELGIPQKVTLENELHHLNKETKIKRKNSDPSPKSARKRTSESKPLTSFVPERIKNWLFGPKH
jgi:uncharacterized protein YjcR